MIDFSTPLAGLDRASAAVQKVASRVAQTGETGGDSVDLSSEAVSLAVSLMVAKQNFESNVKVVHTYDQINKSLLDLLG